ncbi:MAG: hypothetical protein RBS27_00925 [Giesbergeria sp.]|jgi:hypothetical protein|nr:hypothetical protein [Giesbergeria sp.]
MPLHPFTSTPVRPAGQRTPLVLSAVLALTLTACGGSGDPEATAEAALDFVPGEVVTLGLVAPDGSVQESHYLMHGVDQDGQLLTQDAPAQHGTLKMAASADNQRPMIALPLENSQQTNTPRLAALRAFYQQLWHGIAQRRAPGTDIAAEIGDLEADIAVLYDDYRRSGFTSVNDYVVFYEQVGENPFFDAQETVEEELLEFFYATGSRQSQLLQTLAELQWDWPGFLKLMAQRGHTFASLLRQYRSFNSFLGTNMPNFIKRYVNFQAPPRSGTLAASTTAKAQTGESNEDELFFPTKTSLSVNVNSNKQKSIDILAAHDKDVKNYYSARIGYIKDVCPTRIYIKGRLGRARAELAWKMKYMSIGHNKTRAYGRYAADFGMEFFGAAETMGENHNLFMDWLINGFNYGVGSKLLIKSLNVNMEVMDFKNIGTKESPRPGFKVKVKIKPNKIFNSPWVNDCDVNIVY